jgi:hypothetical protein
VTRRLPHDAFSFYMSLGAARSYTAVAEKYGVSKRAVTRRAASEQWQQRAAEMEEQARKKADEKLQEKLEEMHVRHLKLLAVIQGKALEALRNLPLSKAMEAVRALELCIREERATRGEAKEGEQGSEASRRVLQVITNVDEPEA